MSNCFILLAAGKGKRFKSKKPKQFVNYKNKPLFKHSVDKALKSNLFKEIIIVTNKKIKMSYKNIKIIKAFAIDANFNFNKFNMLELNKSYC